MRLVRLVRGQPVDLLVAVHGVPQVEARAQLQVARLEHALQQQDRAAPAQIAHTLRLGQIEQREAVGAAQAFEGALDAVAVGIGLDDGPHPRARRGGAHLRQVVAQRAGVDGGVDRARHGSSSGNGANGESHGFWHLHRPSNPPSHAGSVHAITRQPLQSGNILAVTSSRAGRGARATACPQRPASWPRSRPPVHPSAAEQAMRGQPWPDLRRPGAASPWGDGAPAPQGGA